LSSNHKNGVIFCVILAGISRFCSVLLSTLQRFNAFNQSTIRFR